MKDMLVVLMQSAGAEQTGRVGSKFPAARGLRDAVEETV